jgi:RNA polymerase sigma-54 factor
LALALVDEHLELLANRDFERLKGELKTSKVELDAAIALIHTLNPKPGALLAHSQAGYVIPDILVSRQDGRWIVELNPEVAPRLRVNALYAACLDRGRRSDSAHVLRRDLQEARWLIRSLKMRNHTLLRVARALVEHQQAFLARGEEAMRPLAMKDIAERLDMHESTISRVTAGKYMYTPRGIFEFKYFFSTQVGEHGNEEHSATAIRPVIRKLIAAENPRRPLSDGQITTALGEQGIKLARRTTAKYRESMAIPASHERKQLRGEHHAD